VEKPDERSVMTYVSEFFHAFASANQTEAALRRAKKFLDFARHITSMQNDYETRATALVGWLNDSTTKFEEYTAGETLDDALEALQYFRSFVVEEKPPQLGEFFDLMALLAEIQTDLKVNGRPDYQPPQGLTPQDIDQLFESLAKTETSYGDAARAQRFIFVHKNTDGALSEEQLAEFKASFAHFDANHNGSLSPPEFRAALTAVNVAYRDDEEFMRVFQSNSTDGNVTEEQYINFMTGLAADKDTPEQVKESFAQLAGGNPSHISQAQLAHFNEEEQAFIIASAPQNENGDYEFSSFIDASYA
jgi:Ca2+-binding EF-hand superfamily protein